MKDNKPIRLFIPAAPPTANLIWRQSGGRSYLSPKAAAFERLVGAVALFQRARAPSSWRWVDVSIFVSPTRRAGDVDNRIKITLDALTRARVWDDDQIVASVSARMVKTSKKGATWIEIRPAAAPKFADWRDFGLVYEE
jgi:Holliday junction resolvase RusA-like endonuclease